jgi:nucleolar GTP-binding protein
MDLSEQCGYTVQAQIQLFRSIKPLFSNKLVFLVINKIDVTRPEDLDSELQAELQSILKSGEVEMLQLSCNTQEGVQEVKNAACERLIAERVNQKLKAGTTSSGAIGGRLAEVMARIHVAQPMGGLTREVFIPDAVKERKKYDKDDPERPKLSKDVEVENGGAGVYNVDMRVEWMLKNPDWKYDKMPEIFEGQNVYDFVDPDIEAKLAALEEEEEKLEQEGYYESDEDIEDDEEAEIMRKAELIREKQQLIRNEARMKKRLKNQAIIPRKYVKKPLSEMEDALDSLGVDTTEIAERARATAIRTRGRSLSRNGTADPDSMDVDTPKTAHQRMRSLSRPASRKPTINRRTDGVQDEESRTKAERIRKLNQKKMNRLARQGEGDRHTTASLTKHLVSGLLNRLKSGYFVLYTNLFCFFSLPESVVLAKPTHDKPIYFFKSWSNITHLPIFLLALLFSFKLLPFTLFVFLSLCLFPSSHHYEGGGTHIAQELGVLEGYLIQKEKMEKWGRLKSRNERSTQIHFSFIFTQKRKIIRNATPLGGLEDLQGHV